MRGRVECFFGRWVVEYDAEFWGWDAEVRELFEERLAIVCDGRPVTPDADRIARVEARKAQAIRIAQQASGRTTVRFGCGAVISRKAQAFVGKATWQLFLR